MSSMPSDVKSHLEGALAAVAGTNKDLRALIQAMGVVLKLSHAVLSREAIASASVPAVEGALHAVIRDVGHLYGVCHVLVELSMGLVESSRTSLDQFRLLLSKHVSPEQDIVTLGKTCNVEAERLAAAAGMVMAVQRSMLDIQNLLDEAALRQDCAPRLRNEVEKLLSRLRGNLGG